MDPITHGVLGAVLTKALLFKKDKQKYLWVAGGLSAMAPDLDIFIRSKTSPMLLFLYHRNFTHSLLFIPMGACLVFLGLLLFKGMRKNWRSTLLAAFIGYSSHGLLDACTSYGTMLYWPFANTRVSWDLIAIIDPFFTFPLILGLVWSLVHGSRLAVYIGLTLAGSFLLFNSLQHQRAIMEAKAYAEMQGLKPEALRAIPVLVSSIHWRSLFCAEHLLYVNDIDTLLNVKVIPVGSYPLIIEEKIPQAVKESPSQWRDLELFDWFSAGYTIVVKEEPLTLADGLFLFGRNPPVALWGLEFLKGQVHAKRLDFIKL